MTKHHREPERPDPDLADKHAHLCRSLMEELAQSERSARLHCEREASRLGDSGPARALRACVEHAERANVSLEAAARQVQNGHHAGPPVRIGRAIGALLSRARDLVFDRLIEEERSYRGTLMGLRHGVDTARMLQHAADASGKVELAGFCTRWLADREPLVEQVAREMTWFALHPHVAVVHPGDARELTESAARPN